MLRDECRHFDRALQRRGCRSKGQFSTSVCTFMQFSKCRSKLDVVSAIGFVQDYNTFIYERLFSTLVANVALVALSQTYFGWWASLSAQFWTSGIHLFLGAATIGTLGRRSGICCRVRPSFLRVGAVVSACTFPRPFVVVDYNQFTQQGSRAQI